VGHAWTYSEDRTPKDGVLAPPQAEFGMTKEV